ncbi:MAG: aldo/keto reductase [Methyloceanibacter sp.]|jgi:diketogulonate reductase-like aldo/keto reductase|nr:aldo/keto reductase [Methyloceanibacter sp.]
MVTSVPDVPLPSGERVKQLGQGTWAMGESARKRKEEVAALRLGLDLGMTLIDTAEMYANGGAEEVVAEAIAGRREEVFLVTKVMPENSTRAGTIAACKRSLKRLKTDRIDLYLLHWRGRIGLEETLAGFAALIEAGAIRYWGVSNFDVGDMEELFALPGGAACATNQVLYNLRRRGIEYGLLPWSRGRGVPIMAYSPIEQGRLLRQRTLTSVAVRHRATPAQIALAWVLRQTDMMVIPKAANESHVLENRAALDITLTDADLAELDHSFPPPRGPRPLELL